LLRRLIKLTFIGVLFTAFILFLFRGLLVGQFLEPKLERKLTALFAMPVQIRGLQADPLTGNAYAELIEFRNQPQFSSRSHLYARGVDFKIDFLALRQKKVLIRDLTFDRLFFLIERIRTPWGTYSNIGNWVKHIKNKKRKADLKNPREDETTWTVSIHPIKIKNGTFVFYVTEDNRVLKKFVFHHLEGKLRGFKWPTRDKSQLTQYVKVQGMLGEEPPAPFSVEGMANFSTKKVGFDLKGSVEGGSLSEYPSFWRGLPIKIQDGKFNLETHAISRLGELSAFNRLELQNVVGNVKPASENLFWGIPVTTLIRFLESQNTILMDLPIRGTLSDPDFGFAESLRNVFQNSLVRHLQNGFRLFTTPIVVLRGALQPLNQFFRAPFPNPLF
jgi:hypothetical protein